MPEPGRKFSVMTDLVAPVVGWYLGVMIFLCVLRMFGCQ